MKVSIIKPGTVTTDMATGLLGMVIIARFFGADNVLYIFQPQGINTKTGRPVMSYLIEKARLQDAPECEIDIPLDIIGTHVTDTGTGLEGIAIGFSVHQSGCVHVDIQPSGRLDSNEPKPVTNVDILRLEGENIPKQTEEEKEEQRQKSPSPFEGEVMGDPRM